MLSPMTTDMEYICKLLFDTFKASVKFFGPDGMEKTSYASTSFLNPLYANDDLADFIKLESSQINFPVLKENKFLEHFIVMEIQDNENILGKVVIGPTIAQNIPKVKINGLIHDYSKTTGSEEIESYYKNLPVIGKGELLNISKLLYFLIFHRQLDIADIIHQNRAFMKSTLISNPPELEISRRREKEEFHPPEYYEIELLQCIREGRKELLLKKMLTTRCGGSGILAKNSYLRSQKNLAICGITLATRAAIQGGLGWDLARTLSDVFIQNIEDARDVQSVNRIQSESFIEFTERVQKQNEEKYSAVINQCFHYVYQHLYDHINISQIAESIGVSAVHLSGRFQKEVGQTLKSYIQQEKIEEAKKLILFTDHSILDICVLLHFNDQSYFTKVFKKITGLTPKQYKDRGRLI